VLVLGIGPFGISVAQASATYLVIFPDYGFNLSATTNFLHLELEGQRP
jgi:hypothetical protein